MRGKVILCEVTGQKKKYDFREIECKISAVVGLVLKLTSLNIDYRKNLIYLGKGLNCIE